MSLTAVEIARARMDAARDLMRAAAAVAEIMLACPFCTGPACRIRRSPNRLTLRYSCVRCGRRFSGTSPTCGRCPLPFPR